MFRLKASIIFIYFLFLLLPGCSNSTGPDTQGPYYPPVDSAWIVLENLRIAYESQDLDNYMACFRDDFQFHPLEFNQFDFTVDNQLDSLWGYETEQQCHEVMFDTVFGIELIMVEDEEQLWSGDSTGQSWELRNTFVLKVYIDSLQSIGFVAQGTAAFICRLDTNGEWYVWQWFDESDVKESTSWTYIKMAFLR